MWPFCFVKMNNARHKARKTMIFKKTVKTQFISYSKEDFIHISKRMHENITGTLVTVVWWTALAWVLEWFWLDGLAIWIYATLLLLDFLFGILDAYLLNRKSLTSDTALKGLIRKLIRITLPFLVVLIFRGAGMDETKFITDSIMSILILTEWYSIIWHIVSIDHGKQLPEIDAFEMLCKRIANIFKQWIKDNMKDEEKNEEKEE